jgi:hypothetical protein
MKISMTGVPKEWKRHQFRWVCNVCRSSGWSCESSVVPIDHDRIDGRRCLQSVGWVETDLETIDGVEGSGIRLSRSIRVF